MQNDLRRLGKKVKKLTGMYYRARSQDETRKTREASSSRETRELRRAMWGMSASMRRAQEEAVCARHMVADLEWHLHQQSSLTRDTVASLDSKVHDASEQVARQELLISVLVRQITRFVIQNLRGVGGA